MAFILVGPVPWHIFSRGKLLEVELLTCYEARVPLMQPVQLFLLDAGLMAILADVLHVLEAPLPQQLLLQAVDNALTPLDFFLL